MGNQIRAICLLLLTGCLISAGVPTSSPDSGWLMFRHDRQHTGRSDASPSRRHELKWSVSLSDVEAIAVGGNNTAYVVSRPRVRAISSAGKIRWKTARTSTGDYLFDAAIGSQGMLFVPEDNFIETFPFLNAFSRDGKRVGRRFLEAGISEVTIGPDGTLFVCSDQDLFALSQDRRVRWSRRGCGQAPAIGSDGTVYAIEGDFISASYFNAFSSDGTQLIHRKVREKPLRFGSPAIAPDGTIYSVSSDDRLFAMTPQGVIKWTQPAGAGSFRLAPAIASNGTVYIASARALRAISRDGSLLWKLKTNANSLSSPALTGDHTIYAGSKDGLIAVRPDGTIKWTASIGPIRSDPVIRPDGTVLAAGSDGHNGVILYAFQ